MGNAPREPWILQIRVCRHTGFPRTLGYGLDLTEAGEVGAILVILDNGRYYGCNKTAAQASI
jgi:hypothetical protein